MFRIPVFYQPAQVAPMQGGSPSAEKPKYVVESWLNKFGIDPFDITPSTPASVEQICRVHDADYVRGVLDCTRHNGFGTKSKEVVLSLPYTVGSFVSAAKAAIRNGRVAVSPTSGFHHACYDAGGGFCTFNGLMVAAAELAALEYVGKKKQRVAILDFDAHYGNGTDDIIERLEMKDWILHVTRGHIDYPSSNQYSWSLAGRFLSAIPSIIQRFVRDGAQVLFYQAGADPHRHDPLGGFIDTADMQERDRLVFQTCHDLKLPVVWNLAGGYQTIPGKRGADHIRPVLDLHDNTMSVCLEVFSGKS